MEKLDQIDQKISKVTNLLKIKSIRKEIKRHQSWIARNHFDYDGIKERKEWIEELETELKKYLSLSENEE